MSNTGVNTEEAWAKEAMDKEASELSTLYVNVISFLKDNGQDFMSKQTWKGGLTKENIVKNASKFKKGRDHRLPSMPATVPDEAVKQVLKSYYKILDKDLDEAILHHMKSMGAENAIGDLLERYLASNLEPKGWTWCSGSCVKAVDFIKKTEKGWRALQVKNRDNSENSSSSAIREGTSLNIDKWHRSFSRTGGTNWEDFPDLSTKGEISEKGFQDFINDYLKK